MTAIWTNYGDIYGKTYQIVVPVMLVNKSYSEFAPVTGYKFHFFPRPNLIWEAIWTSRKGPLAHSTTAYTGHVQRINTRVIVKYHIKLLDNSKSNLKFIWAPEKCP